MINEIYVTVQNILNKDSRGYVTPQEFNNYCKLAQLTIFEDMFHEYAKAIAKQNGRLYHSEYSDIPSHLREIIDIFSKEENYNVFNGFLEIADPDFYRLIQLYTLGGLEVEEVSKTEINRLLRNELTAPSRNFPAFVRVDGNFKIYPQFISQVTAFYIRKPKDPKWTYTTISGNAIFNPSANDYQDFELPYSQYNNLLTKILLYCGVQIREEMIMQVGMASEQQQTNKEQL